LETLFDDFGVAIVTDVRDISTSLTGSANAKNAAVVAALNTSAKNIVGAINEHQAKFGNLTSSDVAEGTNQYFTEARVLAAVLSGFTAGAGAISGTDTVQQAIQKLQGNIDAIDTSSVIDDNVASDTKTYSSNKIAGDIAAAVANALEGEDLSDVAASISALAAADQNLLSFGGAQSLTSAQKTTAQVNLGLGNLEAADFAAAYTAARDA